MSISCELALIPSWRHQMETFSTLLPPSEGNHRSPVVSPYKGQWRGALMFSLICARTNGWAKNRDAGDLKRYCAHYNVIVIYECHRAHRICQRWFWWWLGVVGQGVSHWSNVYWLLPGNSGEGWWYYWCYSHDSMAWNATLKMMVG